MLSRKELIILDKLRKNARKPLTKISKELNIPLSTLCDNLKKLNNKIIKKHTSLIDFSKLGYSLKIYFTIQTKDRQKLKEYLINHQNINSVSKATNNYFLVEALFKTSKELFDFKEHIQENFEINQIKEHYIIEDIKKEGFVIP